MNPSVRLRNSPRGFSASEWMSLPAIFTMPARRLVETAEDLQQRGLAGTGGADDGDAFAGANREIHALQHLQVDRPLAERAHRRRALRAPVHS